MTQNLRIVIVQPTSSSGIQAKFTEALTTNLSTANVSVLANTPNVPDAEVLAVSVSSNILTITCQPLTPLASYFVQFQSTPQYPFQSVNGDAKLLQDGISNRYLINGPMDPDNPVRDYLISFLRGNIYNVDDENTIVSQYINSLAVNLARALYDIRQAQNENYLSFQVVDEQQVRGEGPFDRLYEEGAYEVMRVGLAPTNAVANTAIIFDDFPSYPVTLQQQTTQETLTISSSDQAGTFNINNLTLNLSNAPVTKAISIVFTLLTSTPVYVYNIPLLGYQIQNSRYDQDFASSYQVLNDNQIQLNTQILTDPNFDINQIFKIDVQYQSKDLGRVVDASTIQIFTTLTAIREVLPPIENIFSLQHAPITDANNDIPILDGVSFLDPNSNTGSPHPAFITEIPFRLNALPSSPGQYSINYNSGTVYVYGADLTNDGTGPSPPLATYDYRFTYTSEVDYVYDVDLLDLVSLPLGNLVNSTGTVSFNYEKVLVPGTDYIAETHLESLSERIGNRLVALNSLTVLNSPITNVFQIYNETSGEIYTLERWTTNNQIYFQYNNPPRIVQQTGERASFLSVTNELLFVNNISTNANSSRIFTLFLSNNNIVDSTEDGTGASFNSSLVFSNGNVFVVERWYDQQLSILTNVNRLSNPGEYMVDYINGIVYLAVSSTQSNIVGTVNYKQKIIVPQFPHVLSVDDIYYRISPLSNKGKQFSYLSFTDGSITPSDLDPVDEGYLNSNLGAPYQVFQDQVGTFITGIFVPGVTNQIKFVRGLYEYADLLNNTTPINFANYSVSSDFNITVNPINKQFFNNVQFDGTNYFVDINESVFYLSPDISFEFSVIRISDGYSLWDTSGTVVPGNPLKLILPGSNSPQTGDLVSITYTFTILPISRVIVDYNKGDYWVDYTYLADEIIVSYEYGDNVIDFRQGNSVSAGTSYYVTYRVGALRDALLKNFGYLVNLPELATLDVSFPRERYRDALVAALSSFLQGPTVAAIKNIGQVISHIEPQVIESSFQTWSLGQGLLYPQGVSTTGSFQLLPAKYGDGVLMDQPGQTITLPINSNIRFEEGTFEQWVLPQWNGLDNDADLTFTITRDGYAVNSFQVFVGAAEYHPPIVGGAFTLNKNSNITGYPNTNKDGIFIYYAPDMSGNFMRWYVEIIDGYVSANNHNYKLVIKSTGKFYDAKSLSLIKPNNMIIFTGLNTLNVSITGGGQIDEGVTFLSDLDHYFLDLGKSKDHSRLSIFKDVSGYLNFRVWDRSAIMYSISTDVSHWKANQAHQIAASWKLGTRNERDEMHLFVDGLEVPNIMKYGQKLQPYLHEKFRTVDPEEIVGLSNRDIVGSTDLTTLAGTNSVSSSINFAQYQIFPGDTIIINELGFSAVGYTILVVNGQVLELSDNMPLSLAGDGRFSINQTQFTVTSDINVAPNITVSTIHTFLTGTDLSTMANSAVVTSTGTNFTAQGVQPGYLLRIDNSSPELTYNIVQVSGNSLTITDPFPTTQSNVVFQVYSNVENEIPGVRALHPAYSISQNANFQNILTISNDVLANDLILVRTLGLNHRDVKKQYYVWSNQQENVLMTQLPPPISLDQADITKIVIPVTGVGPNNSTVSAGIFTSNPLPGSGVSNSQDGRTIQATIAGTNVDFSVPVQVTINGVSEMGPVVETISFTDYGTLNFANQYLSVNYVIVMVKPINSSKNALTIDVREKYPITHSEFSGLVPVVRYSYHINGGYNLSSDGYGTVFDGYNTFSGLDINNYLIIHSPPAVAGYYVITGLSADRHSITINPTVASFPLPLADFTNGVYQVLNVNQYRSGLQNGFFTLEASVLPSQAYYLSNGFYELDYATYTRIKLDPLNGYVYFGSDFEGKNQANAILDEVKIYSIMLTDTRIGETISSNQYSITKDFNSLKSLKSDPQTLVLLEFDTFPFTNSSGFYVNTDTDRQHFQSNWAVNDNFDQSLVFLNQPVELSNDGILDTRKQATIEFWVSPLFDTANDPSFRYYFDAYGAVVEQTVSASDVAVKISSPIGKVLSVKLAAGDPNIDYFAGGKLEIDTQNAIQEEGLSMSNTVVIVAQSILQVITVKVIGDFTGTDYFTGGAIGTDGKTIYLGKPLPQNNLPLVITYQPIVKGNSLNSQIIRLNRRLPYQNSQVIVNYIPKGLQGDRISIFKDRTGSMNFRILASGTEYLISAPTFWAKNTWHRVKASYKINGNLGMDEMRLFLDGYQYSNITFGTGAAYGKFPMVLGSVVVGDGYVVVGNIKFKDPINNLFIGSQYNGQYPVFSLLDNFRISNVSRPIYAPYGEPIDVNYSTNLQTVLPVTQDLYTTYLMNYDKMVNKNQNFAILTNRAVGSFDFTVNIFDSFGIVSSSIKVKETLEALINTLKPANCSAFIQYIT